MVDEKVLSRIKKLLAMSQDAGSEQEAMIAAKRLQSLLSKYNLSIGDVDKEEEVDLGELSFEEINWPWKRFVLMGVTQLYFCTSWYCTTRKNHANYYIAGSDINRMTAKHVVERIFDLIPKLAKVESKKVHGRVVSSFTTSFCTAAGHRIYFRCQELIEQAKNGQLEDESGNTLPSLLNVYDDWNLRLDEYTSSMGLRTKSAKTRSRDQEGHRRGKQAGNNVNLNTALHRKTAPKQLR